MDLVFMQTIRIYDSVSEEVKLMVLCHSVTRVLNLPHCEWYDHMYIAISNRRYYIKCIRHLLLD